MVRLAVSRFFLLSEEGWREAPGWFLTPVESEFMSSSLTKQTLCANLKSGL